MAKANGKPKLTNKSRNALIGFSFLSFWIIGFLAFTLYPVILSAIFSVNKLTLGVNGIEYKFEGLSFFDRAFNVDTDFTPKLLESFLFDTCR